MANEKLIYAGPLERQFENLTRSWRGTFSGPAYADALERLRNAPKVDAVPVVRCLDCKSFCVTDGFYSYNEFVDWYVQKKTISALMEKSERKDCSFVWIT